MSNKKPVVLAILDGYGHSETTKGNAIFNANTPYMDKIVKEFPHTYVQASGSYVGLPDGQIGNSEVGHLNIGAGRIVYTGLSLINNDIKTKKFESNQGLLKAIEHAKKNNSHFHVMGLLSPGGVHSNQSHIFEIIRIANMNGLKPIVHVFGDGRDVAPASIKEYLDELLDVCSKNNGTIASIAGRFYAMDRDKRWDRTKLAYDNLLGISSNIFKDVKQYVDQQYAQNINDEFLVPARIENKDLMIKNNDAIVFANFRPDRARQLSHLFCGSTIYDEKNEHPLSNIFFGIMMNYEGITPSIVLFPSVAVKKTLGEVLEKEGLKQLRIAETEKYAHVTFFFDGGIEIDFNNEQKVLIDSPKVKTYDEKPEMSAEKIADKLIEILDQFDVVILNFANADMIGHTGMYDKAVQAIECLDKQLIRIDHKLQELNGVMFITADHGNAEEMLDENNNVVTKHSTNPVIFACTDKSIKLSDGGALGNIAPTILDYLGIKKPEEMSCESLLKK